MKKSIFVGLSLIIYLALAGCSSGKKAYTRGDYYQSVMKSVNRLQRNPGQKKSASSLRSAYPQAVEYYENQAKNKIASNDPYKWKAVVDYYNTINYMYEAINRSPGALAVIPNPINHYADLEEAKKNAAEEAYSRGLVALSNGTREDAKVAFKNFEEANSYVPGYKDVVNKMEEALWAATLKVLVEPIPVAARNLEISAEFFENKFNEYLLQQNINEFVRFFTVEEAQAIDLQPDQVITLGFDEFQVGQVYFKEKEIEMKKDSVLLASSGTYTKNTGSAGNFTDTSGGKTNTSGGNNSSGVSGSNTDSGTNSETNSGAAKDSAGTTNTGSTGNVSTNDSKEESADATGGKTATTKSDSADSGTAVDSATKSAGSQQSGTSTSGSGNEVDKPNSNTTEEKTENVNTGNTSDNSDSGNTGDPTPKSTGSQQSETSTSGSENEASKPNENTTEEKTENVNTGNASGNSNSGNTENTGTSQTSGGNETNPSGANTSENTAAGDDKSDDKTSPKSDTKTGSGTSSKITVCHLTGSGKSQTLEINRSALKAHLDHGDITGACISNKGQKSKNSTDANAPANLKADGDVYGTVKATVFIYTKTLSSNGILDFKIIDASSGSVVSQEKMAGEYEWITQWATFNGDERALTPEQLELSKLKEAYPPSNQDLFIEFTRPIFDQMTGKVQQYYRSF